MSENTIHQDSGSNNHVHKPIRQFFLPDQVAILAEFETNEGLEAWLGTLPSILDGYEISVNKIYRIGEEASSVIVILNITSTQGNSTQRVIDAVNRLNNTVVSEGEVVASPNWLYGAAPHGFGDGGPGGKPKAVADADKHKYHFKKTKVRQIVKDVCGNGKAVAKNNQANNDEDDPAQQPVNVVILDTAPLGSYVDFMGNELLNSLRPLLTVYHASNTGIPLPVSLAASEEAYWLTEKYRMTDHGLFIAGTVHTWAREAKIHLVEVLNDYGVCSLVGLIDAFDWIRNKSSISRENPLVINCSICLCPPVSFLPDGLPQFVLTREPESDEDEEEELAMDWANSLDPEVVALMMQILHRTIEATQNAFSTNGVRVIAAAGNAGVEGELAPDTSYPAAYDCVVGVGSVESNGNRVWYSNKADVPPEQGLMVFGGKAKKDTSGQNETIAGEGMLGIYLDRFPDGTCSPNGWAWWSGTSFATGVVSGMFAYAAGQCCHISCKDEDDFKHKLKDNKDDDTALNEPILKTPQGPK